MATRASEPRREETEPSPQATRARLVAAAAEVFRRQGYDGTRVGQIAKAAGVTTGAIYSNFDSKADLLATAILEFSLADLDRTLQLLAQMPVDVVLRELGAGLASEEYPVETLLIDAAAVAQRDAALASRLQEEYARRERIVGDIVEKARRSGRLRPDVSTPALVRLVSIIAMGALVLRHVGLPAPPDDEWTALIHVLVDALVDTPPDPASATDTPPA